MIKTRVGIEGFDLLVEPTVMIADCVTQTETACSDQWLVAIIANACNEVNQGKDSEERLCSQEDNLWQRRTKNCKIFVRPGQNISSDQIFRDRPACPEADVLFIMHACAL